MPRGSWRNIKIISNVFCLLMTAEENNVREAAVQSIVYFYLNSMDAPSVARATKSNVR